MALAFNKTPHGVIGACIRASGTANVVDATDEKRRLALGAHLRRGDLITTAAGAYAELAFLDGTKIVLSEHCTIELEDYFYADDVMEDGAQFNLSGGTCVLKSGEIGDVVNGLTMQVGGAGLSIRAADVAVRMQIDDYDLVSLLPRDSETAGEVLVQGRFNVAVLESIFQTIRLGDEDADLPEPLTLPSGMITETYLGPGLDKDLVFSDLFPENTLEFTAEKPFALFRADDNQMFERPLSERTVYPAENPSGPAEKNELLEDSFVGERFRLDNSD